MPNVGPDAASLQLVQLSNGFPSLPTTAQLLNQSALLPPTDPLGSMFAPATPAGPGADFTPLQLGAPLPHSLAPLPISAQLATEGAALQSAEPLSTSAAPPTGSAQATGLTPLGTACPPATNIQPPATHSGEPAAADVAEARQASLNSPHSMQRDPMIPLMQSGALDKLALLSHCANAGRFSDDPLAMWKLACMDMGTVDSMVLQGDSVPDDHVPPKQVRCAHLET